MSFTLRSAADAAARAKIIKNETRSARITILLFTRKGLRWTVYAGLLALRVRMRNPTGSEHPVFLQSAFPGILPVTGCDFLACSCAAARDLHPLPFLPPQPKTPKPNATPNTRQH